MHEFGHAAGLEDLYRPKYGDKQQGYLMEKTSGLPPYRSRT